MTNPLNQKLELGEIYLIFGIISIFLIGLFVVQKFNQECCSYGELNTNECYKCPNPDIKYDVYKYIEQNNYTISSYGSYKFYCESYKHENNIDLDCFN